MHCYMCLRIFIRKYMQVKLFILLSKVVPSYTSGSGHYSYWERYSF